MKNLSSILKLSLKIIVSAGLLLFLVKKLSFSEIKTVLVSAERSTLFLAAGVLFASNLLGAVQWHLLLVASGVRLSFHRTFRYYFVGLFFNNFLPANVGGDAVKVYDVSRISSSVYQIIAVTVLDRLLGIFGLCLLASITTVIMIKAHPVEGLWFYLAIFAGCMIPGIGLYLFKPLGNALRKMVLRIRPLSIDKRITQVLDYLGEFKGKKSLILKLVFLSILIQGLRVQTHILVGMALGVKLDPVVIALFFIFVPLLSLAMIPPITINGLGVREGLGILLFARAGIGRADAFLMEFLTYAIAVVLSLLGWAFFVARRPVSLNDIERERILD